MLIDTHCHLTSTGLVERVDEVLTAARDAGVGRMVMVTEDPDDGRVGAGLLEGRPELFLVTGIHPHRAGQCTPERLEAMASLLRGEGLREDVRDRIVGVGETGVDLYYDFAPQEQQEEVLRAHLALAVSLNRPVVIHARQAEVRVCEILAEFPALAGRVVFHCYSGDKAATRRVLDLGCYCSFTGVVTFKHAGTIRESARFVPIDRIMVETDAPFLSPEPVRATKPNEPALVVHTARFLADMRGEDIEAFAAATTANAIRFFGLPEG